MRELRRISAMLYGSVCAIMPEDYASISQQFQEYIALREKMGAGDPVGPARVGRDGIVSASHPQVEVVDGLALMTVDGVIGKHLSMFDMDCGGYCLARMSEQLINIRDDESIQTLVINFNSPGGTVTGVETVAHLIREVSASGKRVVAYTDSVCGSAAYWLAAACDEIYAERSARLGSVSTICAAVDSSKQWAESGRELLVFRTGDKKGMGTPGKAWTEEEKRFMKESQMGIDGRFKGFIANARGLTDADMQGQAWYAEDAPEGVVDGLVDSLSDLIIGIAA